MGGGGTNYYPSTGATHPPAHPVHCLCIITPVFIVIMFNFRFHFTLDAGPWLYLTGDRANLIKKKKKRLFPPPPTPSIVISVLFFRPHFLSLPNAFSSGRFLKFVLCLVVITRRGITATTVFRRRHHNGGTPQKSVYADDRKNASTDNVECLTAM